MTMTEKGADVVVIGLGAAGGAAVLPLAQAGLEIVGLKADTRYSVRDYPADEIRNDVATGSGGPRWTARSRHSARRPRHERRQRSARRR